MVKRWSLSARLVTTVALTVAIALLLFAGLTAFRLQDGAERQREAVAQLARERFDAQLELEVQLAHSFLDRMSNDVAVAVAGLAERSETRDAVQRGNIVAIDLLMKRVARSGPLDGILVLDTQLNALGSQQPGLDLLAVNRVIAESTLAAKLRALLIVDDPGTAPSYDGHQLVEAGFVQALGLTFEADALLLVSARPVLDDFGDVVALLIGTKIVSGEEAVLKQFARTWELAIQVFDAENPIMALGGAAIVTGTRDLISKCALFANKWQLCVGSSRAKLAAQTERLEMNIEREKSSLLHWLAILSALSLFAGSLAASLMTRRVLAPLADITRVIRSVAKGNWLAHVVGRKRRDEVGEIARAVLVLQESVKERERLQASVADVEQVIGHRRDLTEAMQNCRTVLRRRLLELSNMSERVEENSKQLVGLGGLAECEADEARLVTLRSSSKVTGSDAERNDEFHMLVRGAIDRFGETAARINSTGQDTAEDVKTLVANVRGLDHVVKRFLGDLDTVPTLPDVPSPAKIAQ